jgi:hypothetical protein
MAVLGHSIMEPFCVQSPLAHDGARDRHMLSFMRERLASLAAFTDAAPDRTTHVAYPDLAGHPAATALALVSAAGLPADEQLPARVEEFMGAQRSGRRLAPPRELDTMGYTHGDVQGDPIVRDYCRRFGVHPERERLTGTQPPTAMSAL